MTLHEAIIQALIEIGDPKTVDYSKLSLLVEEKLNNKAHDVICPNCQGEANNLGNGSRHCEYCDFWW